jgi:hypothetical protein
MPEAPSIVKAIDKALDPDSRSFFKATVNPYGQGNASDLIHSVLKNTNLNGILKKPFFDIQCKH